MMPWLDVPSLVHRTCRIPSVPRARPMSPTRLVPAGVTLDHLTAAAAGPARSRRGHRTAEPGQSQASGAGQGKRGPYQGLLRGMRPPGLA